MAPFPRGRALVIGVGEYGDARWNVPTATRDGRAIHDTLIDPDLAGYGRGQVELLPDRQATRAGVLAALARLAARCAPDSVAVISITSHGALGEDGLYYIATSDARFGPGDRIVRDSGLHVGDLARALRDIPARQLLLIVNTCAAGHLHGPLGRGGIAREFEDLGTGQMLPDAAATDLLATGEGRAIITASRADQLSYYTPREEHSYFGQALIDALRGSAANAASGYVGLYELYESVFRQVRDITQRRLGIAQEPVLTLLQNVGPFPLASYPRAAEGHGQISQRPPLDLPVRVIERDVITARGQGATAIKAEAGSTVSVDNSKLIDFGGATVMGGVTIGNVARGDIIAVNSPLNTGPAPDLAPDPMRDLPILRERVAAARNVDEDARDEAALRLSQAHRSLSQNDPQKAYARIGEALELLREMDNGYVRSIARKIEAVREAVGKAR